MKHLDSKRIVISAGVFISFLILAGCAPGSYYGGGEQLPAPIPTTLSSEDGVTVKVTPNYWPYTPRNLPDYVTPYYVEIDNQSGKTIDIYYGDVVLFDPYRAQYNPLAPEVVASAISTSEPSYGYSAPSYPRVSVGVGFGVGGGYYGRRGYGRRGYYGPSVGIYNYYPGWYAPPTAYQAEPVSTKSVLTFALGSGPVYPGSTVSGYVYFRHLPKEVPEVFLDIGWRDPENPDDMQVLSFPFALGLYNNQ
jgi:hypothetical protein